LSPYNSHFLILVILQLLTGSATTVLWLNPTLGSVDFSVPVIEEVLIISQQGCFSNKNHFNSYHEEMEHWVGCVRLAVIVQLGPELVQSLLGESHLVDCFTRPAFVRGIPVECRIGCIKSSTRGKVVHTFNHAEEVGSIVLDETFATPSGTPWLEKTKLSSDFGHECQVREAI